REHLKLPAVRRAVGCARPNRVVVLAQPAELRDVALVREIENVLVGQRGQSERYQGGFPPPRRIKLSELRDALQHIHAVEPHLRVHDVPGSEHQIVLILLTRLEIIEKPHRPSISSRDRDARQHAVERATPAKRSSSSVLQRFVVRDVHECSHCMRVSALEVCGLAQKPGVEQYGDRCVVVLHHANAPGRFISAFDGSVARTDRRQIYQDAQTLLMSPKPESSEICRVLFSAQGGFNYKRNFCGTLRRQAASSRYSSLISHLRTKHQDVYKEGFALLTITNARDVHAFGFANNKITNIYGWMSWVVARNVPLCKVKDTETRKMTRLNPTTAGTLKIYLAAVTRTVEGKIKANQGREDRPRVRRLDALFRALRQHVCSCVGWRCASSTSTGVRSTRGGRSVIKIPLLAYQEHSGYLRRYSGLGSLSRWYRHQPQSRALSGHGIEYASICENRPRAAVGERARQCIMARFEQDAVRPFEMISAADKAERPSKASLGGGQDVATQIVLRQYPTLPAAGQACDDVPSAIPHTSNRCERLFLLTKLIVTPQRTSLLPVDFEMLTFLCANQSY
ncbi:hypothetical protein PybrP1_002794, partial [[Pythium] brassicae (nom. inval.)]